MLLVAVITRNVQAQTVRRVSNALGANAPYTTISAAIAASADGDIILVEGSQFDYNEAITLTKRVTIQGPGNFLNENTGLQANPYSAYNGANSFTFNAGSAGSIMSGMRINSMNINTSNITISGNRIQNSLLINTTSSNISISGNYIGGTLRSFANVTNLLIANNYVGGGINFFSPSIGVVVLGVVTNNVIDANGVMENSTITNNIFINTNPFNNPPITSTLNSTVQNNVFIASSQPGADGTNIFGVAFASLFVGLTGNTTDTQWRLKSGSPAIGAGTGGTDCGMYGGTTPYKVSGIAAGQPTIYSLTTPGTAPANGTLNVKVSAKVN